MRYLLLGAMYFIAGMLILIAAALLFLKDLSIHSGETNSWVLVGYCISGPVIGTFTFLTRNHYITRSIKKPIFTNLQIVLGTITTCIGIVFFIGLIKISTEILLSSTGNRLTLSHIVTSILLLVSIIIMSYPILIFKSNREKIK